MDSSVALCVSLRSLRQNVFINAENPEIRRGPQRFGLRRN
jgi:hypothetical protein